MAVRIRRRERGRIVAPGTRSRRQPRRPLDPFGRRVAAAILVLAASFQLAAFLLMASAVLLAGRFAQAD